MIPAHDAHGMGMPMIPNVVDCTGLMAAWQTVPNTLANDQHVGAHHRRITILHSLLPAAIVPAASYLTIVSQPSYCSNNSLQSYRAATAFCACNVAAFNHNLQIPIRFLLSEERVGSSALQV